MFHGFAVAHALLREANMAAQPPRRRPSADLKAIHKEHEDIQQRIGEVDQAIDAKDVGRLQHALERLQITVLEHFRHEEMILTYYKYPNIKIHKAQHTTMRRSLKNLVETFRPEDIVEFDSRVIRQIKNQLYHQISIDQEFLDHLSSLGNDKK